MTRAVSNPAAPRAGANHPAPSSSPARPAGATPTVWPSTARPAAVASYCQYLAQHPGLADAARRELAGAIQSLH